jgi:hypothetical protein
LELTTEPPQKWVAPRAPTDRMETWRRCYDHDFRRLSPIFRDFCKFSAIFANFQRFSPIFGEKWRFSLKKQLECPNIAKLTGL